MNLVVEVSDLNKEAKRAEKGVFLTVFGVLELAGWFLGLEDWVLGLDGGF
jgi:hypothetical protein